MSDSDSGETIHSSDSEWSNDYDSEGSLTDFIDDDTPEKAITSRAEISRANIIQGKRKRQKVEEEEEASDYDSSADYCPSE